MNSRWGGGALQLYNENAPQVELYCNISVTLDPPEGGVRSTIYVTISSNYPSWYAYWYDHDGSSWYYRNNPTYFEDTNSNGPAMPGQICHSVIVYDENDNIIASYNHPPNSGGEKPPVAN